MATGKIILSAAFLLLVSFALAGCTLPSGSSPLVTSSRDFTLAEGQSESFRLDWNGTTPEYSLRADSVMNKTASFTITPGNIALALTEGTDESVDLNADGMPDIVVALGNTTGNDAEVTVYVAGAAPVCTNECQIGERQKSYPDCSCFTPVQNCSTTCPTGQVQRPHPDCSCYTENRTCTDGTLYGQCSATQPLLCVNGTLSFTCGTCGCPTTKSCNATAGTCFTPSAAPTPVPGATPTPTPVPTVTPVATPSGSAAIAVANQTEEGAIMVRLDALYRESQSCTQSEFSSTFTARMQRAPRASEISQFSTAKSYLPTEVTVSTSVNGTATAVLYQHGGAHPTDALRVVVSSGAAVSRQWLDGTTTAQNLQLLTSSEAISGNCGLIMTLNGW